MHTEPGSNEMKQSPEEVTLLANIAYLQDLRQSFDAFLAAASKDKSMDADIIQGIHEGVEAFGKVERLLLQKQNETSNE